MERGCRDASTPPPTAYFGTLSQFPSRSRAFEKGKETAATQARAGVAGKGLSPVKAGVHLKAVLTSLNTAFLPISRSRFKQRPGGGGGTPL